MYTNLIVDILLCVNLHNPSIPFHKHKYLLHIFSILTALHGGIYTDEQTNVMKKKLRYNDTSNKRKVIENV